MSDERKVHDLRDKEIKKKDNFILFTTISGKGIQISENDHVLLDINGRGAEYLVHTIKYYFKTRFKATLIFVRYLN